MSPPNGAVFASAGNGITFKASSGSPIAAGNIKLILNSFDETANLVITGDPADRIVTFSGLTPNRRYSALITVSNAPGVQTAHLDFDTFNESGAKILESEDYNYNSGAYQLDPAPSGFDAQCNRTPGNPALGYAGQTGVLDVDYFATIKGTTSVVNCPCRGADSVSTRETFDVMRTKHAMARVRDYHVRHIADTEWLNYTSKVDPDIYSVYLRAAGISSAEINLEKVDMITGDRRMQGTFLIPDRQNCGFSYIRLTDGNGHPASVNLSGISDTLRLTVLESHPSICLNYLLLVKAGGQPPPQQPVIENARRNGSNFEFSFATASGRRYTVQSGEALSQPDAWRTLATFGGTGAPHSVSDPVAGVPQRFYRVAAY